MDMRWLPFEAKAMLYPEEQLVYNDPIPKKSAFWSEHTLFGFIQVPSVLKLLITYYEKPMSGMFLVHV